MNDEITRNADGSVTFRSLAATVTYAPDETRRRGWTRPTMTPVERRDVAEEDRLRRMYPTHSAEKQPRVDPVTQEEKDYYRRAYPHTPATSRPGKGWRKGE